jgi:hypothetical protein
MSYASHSDLYRFGLPRGMLANPGRIASALSATQAFELDGHGFATDEALLFRAESGGTLPTPIVAGATYYAIRVNDQMFKVAAAPGGPVINLTSDGSSVVVATPLPIDEVLEFYSRFVDGFLPAHFVPLSAPSITVRAIVAELAAKKLLLMAGQSSQSMTEQELAAKAQLERWAKSLPLRDGARGSANLAYSESVRSETRPVNTGARNWDPRFWDPRTGSFGGGGTLP